MNRSRFFVLMSLFALILFAGFNIAAQKFLSGARLDFTGNRLYTLSTGTRQTLKDMAEPVELTFVFSRHAAQDYPAVNAYAARVRALLEAYRDTSGGRVRLIEIDPAPFSEAEDMALAAGISGLETDGPDPLYFGLIGRNTIDDERVIPFLAPELETTLEYDLTRMIARLDDPEPPRIGILSSLPGLTSPAEDGGFGLLADLAKSFDAERLPQDFQSIPDSIDVLLIAHPDDLTRRQTWLIDQFALRKGRILFLIDPAARAEASEQGGMARSDLGLLGTAWGLSLSTDAVADAANALEIAVSLGQGRNENMAHPLFIGIPSNEMNPADPVTADLSRTVNFGAPGALITGPMPAGLRWTPLITTGPAPSYIPARDAVRDLKPADVLKLYKTEKSALTLAGRLSGRLRTAFPDGAPPFEPPADPSLAEALRAEAAAAPEHIAQGSAESEIIIVADIDLITDDYYIYPEGNTVVADNGAFILNALDALSGGGELSRLRSRAEAFRPMTRIENMRQDAEARYFRQQAELEDRLAVAQARLTELQSQGAAEGGFSGDLEAVLTEAERGELAQLREDIVSLRGRLRGIERDYRRGIDQLENGLKAINIWFGPLLVAIAGFVVWRRQKRRQEGRR